MKINTKTFTEVEIDVSILCKNCGNEIQNCEWDRRFEDVIVPICERCKESILKTVEEMQYVISLTSKNDECDINILNSHLRKIKYILK